ncbi:MAG: tRNA pseudouridine(38-40) synthase TruA [Candidatus Omnitrophica bacterium]|nr:tRNA pseudouridine(38-40) synthase TruA [Candidatus Omnitrophota bacterium]
MRNIKLTLEYDGTDYGGWQTQRAKGKEQSAKCEIKTIQETIEKNLERILQERINLIGSGRTDAGVHALGYVANFKTKNPLSINSLQMALNSLLPDDIVVKKVEEVDEKFHARYSAKSKVYQYTILNNPLPSPLLRRWTYFYPYSLNIALLKREAKYLLGRHDFSSFCASGSGVKDTTRTIKKISVSKIPATRYPLPATLIFITIEADGFLYKMVRNIVGTLIDINRGKIKGIKEVLNAFNRRKAGETVPAQGLCLLKVRY